MKKLLLPVLLFISAFQMFSQSTFHKSYDLGGDDYGNKIIGSTQGMYVAGSTSKAGAGSYDMFLMKIDSAGSVQWRTQLGGSQFDAGRSVAPFQQFGFIVGGSSQSLSVSHKSDVAISLVDSFGNYYGSAKFGFDSIVETLSDIISVGDTNLLVVGTTQSNTDGGHTNMLIMRLDQQANVLWARTYGTPTANSQGVHIFNIPGAGFIATGVSESGGAGGPEGWIVNFDDTGHIQNQLLIGRAFYDDGRFFTVAGGQIIFGGVAGSIGGPNRSNIFLLAFNPSDLSVIWAKTYGGDTTSSLSSLTPSIDDNLIVGGNRLLPGVGQDAVVFKVNAVDGSVAWAKSFGATGSDDYMSEGKLLEDGSTAVVGSTNDAGLPESNAFVARVGADGSLCDGVDVGMDARDQTDSVTGPSIPGLIDSVVALVKIDTMLTANMYSVTENDYCLGTGIRTLSSKDNTIYVYPNPTSGRLFIESSNGWNSRTTMSVYNILGSEVFSKVIEPQSKNFTIDLSASPKGMYIISFNDGHTITTEKISLN